MARPRCSSRVRSSQRRGTTRVARPPRARHRVEASQVRACRHPVLAQQQLLVERVVKRVSETSSRLCNDSSVARTGTRDSRGTITARWGNSPSSRRPPVVGAQHGASRWAVLVVVGGQVEARVVRPGQCHPPQRGASGRSARRAPRGSATPIAPRTRVTWASRMPAARQRNSEERPPHPLAEGLRRQGRSRAMVPAERAWRRRGLDDLAVLDDHRRVRERGVGAAHAHERLGDRDAAAPARSTSRRGLQDELGAASQGQGFGGVLGDARRFGGAGVPRASSASVERRCSRASRRRGARTQAMVGSAGWTSTGEPRLRATRCTHARTSSPRRGSCHGLEPTRPRALVSPAAPQRRVLPGEGDELVVGAEFDDAPVDDDATRSASWAVWRRCAMAITVRPRGRRQGALEVTAARGSSSAVASSSTRVCGSARTRRARASCWAWAGRPGGPSCPSRSSPSGRRADPLEGVDGVERRWISASRSVFASAGCRGASR